MKPSYSTDEYIFGRLLDLHIFSINYEISGLKLATILTWQCCFYSLNVYLQNDLVLNIYERLPPSSGLTQFLIVCQAFEHCGSSRAGRLGNTTEQIPDGRPHQGHETGREQDHFTRAKVPVV
jgi:hypothetical protein